MHIRSIIDAVKDDGYLPPDKVRELLTSAGIPMVAECVSADKDELIRFAGQVGFPVVAKVVGPIHKSDVGGVVLGIGSKEHLAFEFDRLMQIPDARAVMVQPMLSGTELFIGAKYEPRFGHVVLCGLGGIFVEVLKDVSSGLAPLSYAEAYSMIRSLRGYKIISGTRGQQGVNEQKYAEIIVRLSTLLRFATEIKEIDINPLIATADSITAVNTGNALFIRLGQRSGNRKGAIRHIRITNLSVQVPFGRPDIDYDLRGPEVDYFHNIHPAPICGIPGNCIEDVLLENVSIVYPGRASKGMAYIPLWRKSDVPEHVEKYPEFTMFGELPSWGFYLRHVRGIILRNVWLSLEAEDFRPAIVEEDVEGLVMENCLTE